MINLLKYSYIACQKLNLEFMHWPVSNAVIWSGNPVSIYGFYKYVISIKILLDIGFFGGYLMCSINKRQNNVYKMKALRLSLIS